MSTATPVLVMGRPEPMRWTGAEFDHASESGIFDGRRVELINGEILEIPPMNDPHAQVLQLANYVLMNAFPPDRATVRVQSPMRLAESRPFPDFAIISGTPRQNVHHPTTALLVIEVSDTTLDYDQSDKATLYAAHGIPEYWIIDINGRRIEVRRKPAKRASAPASYEEVTVFRPGDHISSLAASTESPIAVDELLP